MTVRETMCRLYARLIAPHDPVTAMALCTPAGAAVADMRTIQLALTSKCGFRMRSRDARGVQHETPLLSSKVAAGSTVGSLGRTGTRCRGGGRPRAQASRSSARSGSSGSDDASGPGGDEPPAARLALVDRDARGEVVAEAWPPKPRIARFAIRALVRELAP